MIQVVTAVTRFVVNGLSPGFSGCESILKAYKNLYLKIFNPLIFMIYTE